MSFSSLEQAKQSGCSTCYESGLTYEYGFVYTGCCEDDPKCSPTEFYTCDASNKWTVEITDPEVCIMLATGLPIGEKCIPKKECHCEKPA